MLTGISWILHLKNKSLKLTNDQKHKFIIGLKKKNFFQEKMKNFSKPPFTSSTGFDIICALVDFGSLDWELSSLKIGCWFIRLGEETPS